MRACEAGDADACRRAGDLTLLGTDASGADGASAGLWYRAACDRGDAPSCTATALWLERGDLAAADPDGARALLAKACEGGDRRGCYHLGVRHLTGAGVGRDRAVAARWFAAGCPDERPDPQACAAHGALLVRGRDVAPDPAAARASLERACDGDDPRGCRLLAEVLAAGGDEERAALVARRACDLGVRSGCRQAARLARRGSGGG